MARRDGPLDRELLAEALGTFVLMLVGLGVNAQKVLGGGDHGDAFSIHVGWGLAVMIGAYVAAGVSGAHLNPAVTLAMAVHRGFPWRKVVPYAAAQLAGAFAASAVVWATYLAALDAFDGGTRQVLGDQATAGIFATYPQPWLGPWGGIVDQIVGTAILLGAIFALSDPRNTRPPQGLAPLLVGLVVLAIGVSYGFNAGYPINPARDLGPRAFTALAGWGSGVWTAAGGWWWVPVVGPLLGAIVGGALYDACVGRRFPPGDA